MRLSLHILYINNTKQVKYNPYWILYGSIRFPSLDRINLWILEYIKQPWFRQKHVTAGYKYKYKCRSWSKITKEYFLPLVMWKGWGTMGCWSAHPRVHVSCKLTRDLFQVRHVYEVKWSITSRNMSLCHSHTPTFGIAPIIWNNDSFLHIWNNVHLTSLYCSQKWTDKLTK